MRKVCFKCDIEKDLNQFYKHEQMLDGYLNKCKSCTKVDVKKHREANIEKIREYDRNRGNRQSIEYFKEWAARFPKKYKAVNMVNNYIRDGKLKKKYECEQCDSNFSVVAHHDDYDKPLDVRWLCQACHKQWHAKYGEGLNGS